MFENCVIGFAMSVRLSACKKPENSWTNFHDILFCRVLLKFVDTFYSISRANRTKTIQTFHERLQEFLRAFIREKKARKKIFWSKLKHTSYQYTYFTLTVVELTKQKTHWNRYACPVASRVAGCRNEDPNLKRGYATMCRLVRATAR